MYISISLYLYRKVKCGVMISLMFFFFSSLKKDSKRIFLSHNKMSKKKIKDLMMRKDDLYTKKKDFDETMV